MPRFLTLGKKYGSIRSIIRNVFKAMPKIDFSALKTADLRSAAPVNESALPPIGQVADSSMDVSTAPSVPAASAAPVASATPAPVVQVPAIQLQAVAAPAPVAEAPKLPTMRANSQTHKRISLTSLKAGGPSAAPAPATQSVQTPAPATQPQATVTAQATAAPPAPVSLSPSFSFKTERPAVSVESEPVSENAQS
ncbi:MAG: hypothetical protein QG650_1125, partial [Patescibacteria group bacterium]|nr:hypothetical protein [Patescibacteria group bacterium]